MRIYIAGKISGLSRHEYYPKFIEASDEIRRLGHKPVNPVYLEAFALTYDQYMDIGFKLLATCDAIYMLPNWQDSPGARREKECAEFIGLKVFYDLDGIA